MFNVGRELFFVPVIMVLKCLCDRSDAYIYQQLNMATNPDDHYYKVKMILHIKFFPDTKMLILE